MKRHCAGWLAAISLAACSPPADGAWQPVPDMAASAAQTVPADGQPRTIIAFDGSSIVQPIPLPDGAGFSIGSAPPYPGTRFDTVTLRRAPSRRPDGVRLFAAMPFTVDASPATVLDWYQNRLAKSGITSQRDGYILNAALPHAHLTIAFETAPGDLPAKGTLRFRHQ